MTKEFMHFSWQVYLQTKTAQPNKGRVQNHHKQSDYRGEEADTFYV